ncbi:MAG TPA: trp RNA-binding attenuation protein MtrB [Candidatus Avimonoglobus intestinipullorum]|uniref:Transcription attenuation protein MtrB n=1 Tax=Candidatus Avimonoglobus intestinipullorum TaxID=2840699 RepID=A0A9D1LW05_9FIRM|nr:trp RNA-binding attenuation protein MtrB [Candidatus Avimonoglobus intestinipullorum]
MDEHIADALNDYIVIKALEDGVSIMGITRGANTRFHHTEKLDKGEIYIAQFTETTSAIKIKGNAIAYTKHGEVRAEL